MKFLFIILSIPIIILTFIGCFYLFGPADGGFNVSGKIVSQQGEPLKGCTIELQGKNGDVWWEPRAIVGDFSTYFTVAPFKSEYVLYIRCKNYEPYAVTVDYGESVTPRRPLKLGKVYLKMDSTK